MLLPYRRETGAVKAVLEPDMRRACTPAVRTGLVVPAWPYQYGCRFICNFTKLLGSAFTFALQLEASAQDERCPIPISRSPTRWRRRLPPALPNVAARWRSA